MNAIYWINGQLCYAFFPNALFPLQGFLRCSQCLLFKSKICQFCRPGLALWISKVNSWNLVWSSHLTQGIDDVLLSFLIDQGFLRCSLCLLFMSQICQFCRPGLAPWISKVNSWKLVWSSIKTQVTGDVFLSFFLD